MDLESDGSVLRKRSQSVYGEKSIKEPKGKSSPPAKTEAEAVFRVVDFHNRGFITKQASQEGPPGRELMEDSLQDLKDSARLMFMRFGIANVSRREGRTELGKANILLGLEFWNPNIEGKCLKYDVKSEEERMGDRPTPQALNFILWWGRSSKKNIYKI